MSKTQGNLTEGPILKVLTKLALPIMASAFLGTAYNITDMAWIGQLGSKAIAGVGVGGMYVWLSSGLAALSRMGGQVYVAQSLGKGEREEAKAYAAASVWLSVFFGLLFGAVGAISGMGNTKLCSIITIVLTGMRIPLALVLSRTSLALNGIWWTLTISSVAKGLVLNSAFHRECRKRD